MEQTQISQAEWQIMRVAWTHQHTTSKQINEILADKMKWKSATTKTLIGRLVKKGLLATKSEGRKYIYSPTVKEEETVLDAGRDFLDQICNTKLGHTFAQLIEETDLSQSDIAEIEEILSNKKETAPETVECNCLPGQCTCHLEGAINQ